MEKEVPTISFIALVFVFSALFLVTISPTTVSAADNETPPTLKVTAIGADDNLVNRWGDNTVIRFQVEDENGYEDIKSVEIEIFDSTGFRKEYDNSDGNVNVVDNGGGIETYSYEFNPDNQFVVGVAAVRITATDKENHENSRKEENVFRVTDADIAVTTEEADNITDNSATLNASIDLAGYDNVEARFYYENGTDHTTWDNKTDWENVSKSTYENTVFGLIPYENYEFKASVRLPSNVGDGAKDADNGSVLRFTTLTDNIPLVDTKENATKVGYSSATIHGELLEINWENARVWFQWRKALPSQWENTEKQTLTQPDNFSENLTGLKSDARYYFRAIASNPAGENIASIENFRTLIENAFVETKNAENIKEGRATLNALVNYGDFDNVDIRFHYRREDEDSWDTTTWEENYTKENYSYTLKDLPEGRIYEFYPEIKFGAANLTDNDSIHTFNTGQVEINTDYPTNVPVNPSYDEDRYIIIQVKNRYRDKELRNVTIRALGEQPSSGFRVFSDNYKNLGTIQPDSGGSENFTYEPVNSGEKELEFSVSYRVYQENDFIYYRERDIEISILVTGTEYDNSIDLQISTQNPPSSWIYNGETYTAQIDVHNQRPTEVTGIRVTGENTRDYGVGALQANESTTITLRVHPENYKMNTVNKLEVRAIHELGVSPPLTLKFQVRSENSPVGVFLTRTNSPLYQGETLKFSIVVAASGDSQVEDLVIESLSENVMPEGYWVGEEMKNLSQQEVSTEQVQELAGLEGLGGLLGGAAPSGPETEGEEEEKERSIIGRKLYFEATGLSHEDNALKFEVSYELGNKLITRQFEVDFKIHHTPELILIQSDPVEAVKGSTATVSLEIANEMSTKVEAVMVKPPENILVTPKPAYWIGPMGPDEFLPVEFKVQTDGLEDGDNLEFYPVYRVGGEKVIGTSITLPVDLEEPKGAPVLYYAAGSVVIVLILFLIYWYRR